MKGLFATSVVFAAVFLAAAIHTQAQFRSIIIATEPNAKVWIDDVLYGRTGKDGRLEIKTIATGSHTLRVRADGFKEKSHPLTALQKGEIKIALIQTTDEAELAFQEGERQSTQDREKAGAAYRNAVKLHPTYAEAYLALARLLADAGDPTGAEKAANQARRLRPGYAEASAVLGRIYKDNGDEAKAIATFKRAITDGRGVQPEAYAGLGLLYKEKAENAGSAGDYEAESAAYTEAAKNLRLSLKQLSGAPDAIVIYQLLGLIYEKQKKTAEAISTYEEFLRIFPDANEATAVRSFITQLKKGESQP